MSSSPSPTSDTAAPPTQYTAADLAEALKLLEASRAKEQQQVVRVTQLAEVADPASIPPDMADYFAARGLRIAMASALPTAIAKYARYQRVPVTIADVPDKDRKMFQGLLELGGFRKVGEYFHHGDTCIYKQPIRQFENLGFDAFNRWAGMQSDPENDAAAIQDTVEGQAKHGVRVRATTVDPDAWVHQPSVPSR